MSGFESCCMASRRELRRRLFIVVLLALAALAATQYWGQHRAHVDPGPSDERSETKMPIEKAPLHTSDDLVDLGIGPDGDGPRPEDMVAEAQKALAQGLEARP